MIDTSRERVLKRLRLAKQIAIEQKDLKALKKTSQALQDMGDSQFTEQEAAELELVIADECTKTALYRHFDKDGNLLYVGRSVSAMRRLAEHKHSAHWFEQVARIEIQWFEAKGLAAEAEITAIKAEKPRFNIAHADTRQSSP